MNTLSNLTTLDELRLVEREVPAPASVPAPDHRVGLRLAGIALSVVLLVLPTAWSYSRALAAPGTDAVGVRTVEWLRDHGGQATVAWIEREWYQHHAPPKGGTPKSLPRVVASLIPAVVPPPQIDHPAPVHLLVSTPVPGEGQWQPEGRSVDGAPVLYTTFMRPDAVHTSLVTGLAWLDTRRVRFQLWSGAQEPGGAGWVHEAPFPVPMRPELIAAFNSGFKLADSRGGYYSEGRTVRTLVDGKASMIFRVDGSMTVGMWGRDAVLGPDIAAVRQNLVLLVDHGQPAPNLDQDSLARWGFTPGNRTLVWRSGVGVDAAGHVIYAAGPGLSIRSLADVFLAAGAVRAMELDINSAWVDFFSYHDDAAVPGGTGAVKLLPDMRAPLDKYFRSSSRDFVAVLPRPA